MKASSESGLCAIVIFVAIPNRRCCHTSPDAAKRDDGATIGGMPRLSRSSAAALAIALAAPPARGQEPAPAPVPVPGGAQEPAKPVIRLSMNLDAVLPTLNNAVV